MRPTKNESEATSNEDAIEDPSGAGECPLERAERFARALVLVLLDVMDGAECGICGKVEMRNDHDHYDDCSALDAVRLLNEDYHD